MKSPLHILHLEDNLQDAGLIEKTLKSEGIACAINRVENRGDFLGALERGGIDLILSDFTLPAFDGLSALEIVRNRCPSTPLIIVSGTIGEEKAVNALNNGATDYVLKENLTRLVPAVRRAMQDVKERAGNRRTENELHQIKEQLQLVFSQSPIGIALVGVDGHPVVTNGSLQKMLGYTAEELNTMPFREFTHPEDRAKDLELYEQLVQGLHKDYQLQKRYIRKSGEVVWAHLTVSVVPEAPGQAGFAIAMVEDITARRDLEKKFIEAQKMEVIGHLAGGVAHDFNNILAIIMGYTDLTIQEFGDNKNLRSHLEAIQSTAERAASLTRQLLIFGRKQTVRPVVLDANAVVQELQKMLRRLIDEKIEMTIIPADQVGHIMADSGYVGQVLMNLVINARDAMPEGGKLTIATNNTTLDKSFARQHAGAIPGDYVMISVSDTGVGMSDNVKAHLFEAFFTTKPKGKGTGLGLATCQTIIQQSAGFIVFDSEIGQGTTFKVYFPRVDLPLTAVPGPVASGPLPVGTETLLVVEDEPALRHLACDVLEAQGYRVLRAGNGQEGLRVARELTGQPVGLVVTDLVMPLMGGMAMAEWLRTACPSIKILLTSGYADDADTAGTLLETGMEFLPKPYTPATLTRKVREMLDAK